VKIIFVLITLANILIRSWFVGSQTALTEIRFQMFTVTVITAKLVLLFLNHTVLCSSQAIKVKLLKPLYNKINFIYTVVKFFNLMLLSLDGLS